MSTTPVSRPAELERVLAELVQQARSCLGRDLVGVYLSGSFALGGADAESDCDFLVATAGPLTPSQLEPLARWHSELPHRDGYWNAHLEGSYADVRDLREADRLDRPWPYVDHGSDRLTHDTHCNTVYTRWTLHHHGVPLYGPRASSVVADVPAGVLRSAARDDLRALVTTAEARHGWDAWSQRATLATAARMLRTATVGDVVSKAAAVDWAAPLLPPDRGALLRAAIEQRGRTPWTQPVPDAVVPLVVATVRHLRDLSRP